MTQNSSHPPMRERLRTDYAWTPRQRDVLELIALGKTNLEIADRLGISRDGVKYHVGEILSKLGSSSREEAAEYWRHRNGLAPRFARVFRWSIFAGPVGRVAAVVAVGALAAAAIAIVRSAIDRERPTSSDPATTTPAPVGTATPVATPEPSVAAPFVGTLNGIPIDPAFKGRTAFEICPGPGMTLPPAGTFADVVKSPGPMQIDPGRLPVGITFAPIPDVFLCKGTIAQVVWTASVAAGTPGVSAGAGSLIVSRILGLEPVARSAPASSWQPVIVGDAQGVLLVFTNGGDQAIRGCELTFFQPDTNVMTTVLATTDNGSACLELGAKLFS